MFGLGMGETVLILLLALLFFGAKRLPQLGEAFGKTVRGFRDGMQGGAQNEEKG